MNEIKVEIVADSINQHGDRLTSLVLTYPRIIHAEMLTHRMFSRNASSSRAVPVQKMIEAVKNNTFCPFEFQKAHKGMQGSEYFTDEDKEDCIKLWLESAELALQQAEKMQKKGITKQLINRILEPYQYYTALFTGTDDGWNNFFELRNPQYSFGSNTDNPKNWKSRKEAIKDFPEWINRNDFFWNTINKGQAEIHMMALAEAIWDAKNESTPKQLKVGEWHIPFEDKISSDVTLWSKDIAVQSKMWGKDLTNLFIKVSVAMAARTSYTVVGNEPVKSYEKWIELHDKLIAYDPLHSSPMEHCCICVTDEDYNKSFKGEEKGWFRNYKGFKSYRQIIEESK